MEKETRLAELEKYQDGYKVILAKLETLLKALQDYNKDTINKTFFEKYFAMKYTKDWFINDANSDKKLGDIRKDWRGNIYTEFNFQDKQFEWATYYKRIFLANSEYLEVDSNQRRDVIKNVLEKIDLVENWIANNEKELNNVRATDEKQLIKDLQAVYKKHNCPKIWDRVLSSYEIKYPNN